ncbi:MAG: hypothetical protein WC489_06085 [Patescibacteria group bacterium]|jgi:hypothetical protein
MYDKVSIAWLKFGIKIGLFSGITIGVGAGFFFTEPIINQLFGLISVAVGVATLVGAFARMRGVTLNDLKNMSFDVRRYA